VPSLLPWVTRSHELLIFEVAFVGGPLTQGYLRLSPSGIGYGQDFDRIPNPNLTVSDDLSAFVVSLESYRRTSCQGF
jgi:hypothetical protein